MHAHTHAHIQLKLQKIEIPELKDITKHRKFISPKYYYLTMSLPEIFEAIQKIEKQFKIDNSLKNY